MGAHPRRCGDHWSKLTTVCLGGGSSPQVRGPRFVRIGQVNRLWLIPAGAGTTLHTSSKSLAHKAHPRRCGDHKARKMKTHTIRGSSPQVRGPLFPVTVENMPKGLIPAGAGTTPWLGIPPPGRRAHPRRCGDHWTWSAVKLIGSGSSPQVRGPPY